MTTKISGYATAQGTQAFADRLCVRYPAFAVTACRPLIGTGLITSKIGYGTSHAHYQSEEHVRTLKGAIEAGCNLVDTSSNYSNGDSEKLIANVMHHLVSEGRIKREEIVVVSKVGYIQGQNLDRARQRETEGNSWKEVVKYMDGCWYCIHPDFLVDQWALSADRLGMETIDIYLLHNPELFLFDAKKRDAESSREAIQDALYDCIYRAFERLEQFAIAGRILYYGISSDTFPSPKTDPEHVSLDRVYAEASKAANEVHGKASANHFKVIQLPYNLIEHNALAW